MPIKKEWYFVVAGCRITLNLYIYGCHVEMCFDIASYSIALSVCYMIQAMDKDGNGKLNVAEFREAMEKLGMTHLTGNTVSTILEAMDVHGPIDLEDFLNIVEVGMLSPDFHKL